MSSFVKTPTGAIMHVDNHTWFVEQAKRHGPERCKSMLALLEPTTPVDADDLYGLQKVIESVKP